MDELLRNLPVVTAVVALTTGIAGLRPRLRTPLSVPLAVVMFSAAWWAMFAWWAATVDDPQSRRLLLAWVVPGSAMLALAGMWHSFLLAGRTVRIRRRTMVLFAIDPVLTVLLAATSRWHHLLVTPSARAACGVGWGPVFWVHVGYAYTLLCIGCSALVGAYRRAVRGHRHHYILAFGVVLLPMAASALSITHVQRALPDLSSIAFILTGLVWGWAQRTNSRMHRVPVRTSQVIEAITDAVLVVDGNGWVIEANAAADRMLGPQGLGLVTAQRGTALGTFVQGTSLSALHTGSHLVVGETSLDVRIMPIDAADERLGQVIVVRDVTEVERLRARLEEQVHRDALTGLHNRRGLDANLDTQVRVAHITGVPLCAAMLDIDHFKSVNDEYGHAVGDQVLTAVARHLQRAASDSDLLVRYGGEEFLLLMPATDLDAAVARTEALRERCGSSIVTTHAGPVQVTLSVGVAELRPGQRGDSLLAEADDALYDAKASGRNQVVRATTTV